MASSLTIAPALGHSLVTAQGMAGGYDAIDDRSFWQIGLQEGAVGATDFMVVERGAGANMTVDVGCNTGFVVVQGDTVTNQGLYVVRPHTAVANLDIAAAHATNPRVDSVVVQVDDDEHDAGGNTRARVMVLTGTATGGATLDNRTGAPALPNSAMLLADVLVPATDTTISNSQIRDRRKWARGAYVRLLSTTQYARAGVAANAEIDATNLKARIECTGVPLIARLRGAYTASGAGNLDLVIFQNSAIVTAANGGVVYREDSGNGYIDVSWVLTPAAGSHLFAPAWGQPNAITTTLTPTAYSSAAIFTVEEIVRQNTKNNATTSG